MLDIFVSKKRQQKTVKGQFDFKSLRILIDFQFYVWMYKVLVFFTQSSLHFGLYFRTLVLCFPAQSQMMAGTRKASYGIIEKFWCGQKFYHFYIPNFWQYLVWLGYIWYHNAYFSGINWKKPFKEWFLSNLNYLQLSNNSELLLLPWF